MEFSALNKGRRGGKSRAVLASETEKPLVRKNRQRLSLLGMLLPDQKQF